MKTHLPLLFALFVVSLFSGCVTTTYRESDLWSTRGYGDRQLDYNVLLVEATGVSTDDPDMISDFVVLRACEIAMEKGYRYVAVLGSRNLEGIEQEESQGDFLQFLRLHSASGIFALLHESHPVLEQEFEVKETVDRLKTRWAIDKDFEEGSFDPDSVELKATVFPGFKDLRLQRDSGSGNVLVYLDPQMAGFEGIATGMVMNFENPFSNDSDLEDELRRIGREEGVDAVVVGYPPYGPQGLSEAPVLSFRASLLLIPDAAFGIQWEPGELAREKYEIRRFRRDSAASEAGLLIGDRVIAINGTDMLDLQGFHRLWIGLKPGDVVTMTVVREGKEVMIDVPVVANLVN